MKFVAKTSQGYNMKILFELLKNITQETCLYISADGIHIECPNAEQRIFLDVHLDSTGFDIYQMNTDEPFVVGINTEKLHKAVKNIKKREPIVLKIPHNDNKLTIEMGLVTSTLSTYEYFQTPLNAPTGYGRPVTIQSSDYYRSIKTVCSNSTPRITLSMRDYSVTIEQTVEDIQYSRFDLGEETDKTPIVYCKEFDLEYFKRVIRFSSASSKMHIYRGDDTRSLRMTARLGILGDINIYIKSCDQE